MPQASDGLRNTIVERFGNLDTSGPELYLEDAGYRLTSDWTWLPKEDVAALEDMERDEFDCLLFLCHEWDYGALASQGAG